MRIEKETYTCGAMLEVSGEFVSLLALLVGWFYLWFSKDILPKSSLFIAISFKYILSQ